MEDLDALLADLQNTTAHLQNHRENSRFSNSPGSPKPTFNNSYSYQDDSAPVYQNQKMMREMTVTTKTNYHVPGSGSGAGSPTPINSNLSELDNLLEDLNTARYPPPPPPPATQHQQHYPQHYENRVPTSPSLNGPNGRYSGGSDSRPSVESLLDELQSAVPTSPSNSRRGANRTPERYVVNTVTTTTVTHPHPQHQPVGRQSPAPNPAASSATKELDDLMASLSDFKLNAAGSPQTSDSLYAKPNKPKSSQSQTRTQTQTRARTPDNAQIGDNQLDSMLGTLQSDMSKQGVNTAQKGCCAACSKPIVGQVVTALAKTWHPEHFVCAHCNQELGTKNFFERDGRPYCEADYHNLFSPRCAYCNGPILDKCVSALDKTWHPEHFFCAQCGGQFGEDGFHEKDGKPYCRNDYFQMFAPKCGGCNRPIMENYISALNSQWHPDCFVCRECKQVLSGGNFYAMEGKPICSKCAGVGEDDEDEDAEED